MSFDAGSILGHLRLDRSGFTSGILEAQGLTSMLGTGISTFLANPLLGVASAAISAVKWVKDLVIGTAESADQFGKLAQQTGASVGWLSGMEYAAKLAGVEMGQLTGSLSFLSRSVADAQAGSGAAAEAFAALGVSVAGNRGMEQIFGDVAEAVSRMPDPMARASAVMDIFGRGAGSLVPLLAQGRSGIDATIAEAKRLGLTFDETSAGAAERFNDSLTRIGSALTGLGRQIAVPIFEALAPALEGLAGVIGPALSPMLKALGGLLMSLIPPLVKMYEQALPAFTAMWAALSEIIAALTPIFEPVFEILGSVGQIIYSTVVPALKILTPVIQIVAKAVGAIAEALATVFKLVGNGIGKIFGFDNSPSAQVAVQVSPEDSARRVADKVAPAIVSSVGGVQNRIETSTRRRIEMNNYEKSFALR
ncbi:MAG: hypothetical protein ABFD92_00035 [Planctomycetaceae bacterium]|nr:hypothetical protein [Planctomycetaceae bacterium]